MYMCIYIYTHCTHTHTHTYIYIYTYMHELRGKKEIAVQTRACLRTGD